jgi:TolB-like protein
MRKLIGLAVVTAVMLFSVTARAGGMSGTAYAIDSNQAMKPDYQYRTERGVEPQAEKTLWDYLSFFAIKSAPPEPVQELPGAQAEELKVRTRELVNQLVKNAYAEITDEYVLTVSSFVNLNNLYQTSSLGRYLGEQLIGELQTAGFGVIDIRKSNGLMIREHYGEYGLSRDMSELSRDHDSQAIVVGTYMYANGQILLNARILRNSDGMVLSHANLAFALDGLSSQMLADEAMPHRRGGVVKIEAMK